MMNQQIEVEIENYELKQTQENWKLSRLKRENQTLLEDAQNIEQTSFDIKKTNKNLIDRKRRAEQELEDSKLEENLLSDKLS